MNFDDARQIAMRCFFEAHPPESTPPWVLRNATVGGSMVEGAWHIAFTLARKIVLKPNEAWDIVKGGKVLTRTDFRTGKKTVVIHYDAEPPVHVFRVNIPIDTRVAEVVFDVEVSMLHETDFEPQG